MAKQPKNTSSLPPMTDREALQWIVNFARQDLATLASPGAWLDLSWNLARYLREDKWKESSTDKQEIKEVQDAVGELLGDLSVEGGVYRGQSDAVLKEARREAGRIRVRYAGTPDCNAVAFTMDLLTRIDARRLGRCNRCNSLFLGQRGQLYCGKRCANAVAAETYRKRKAGQLRENAREKYRKKQRENLGPAIRVGRKEG